LTDTEAAPGRQAPKFILDNFAFDYQEFTDAARVPGACRLQERKAQWGHWFPN
jgi:hypothetical protein